jgi:hypothetical protein
MRLKILLVTSAVILGACSAQDATGPQPAQLAVRAEAVPCTSDPCEPEPVQNGGPPISVCAEHLLPLVKDGKMDSEIYRRLCIRK